MSRARRWLPASLNARIFAGLLVGSAAGVVGRLWFDGTPGMQWSLTGAGLIGQLFLRFLFMVVVPLVFASITLGVGRAREAGTVTRIGRRTIVFFVWTTSAAALLGLGAALLLQPGAALGPDVRNTIMSAYAAQAKAQARAPAAFGLDMLLAIVPTNPIDAAARGDLLAIIFFAFFFGIALTQLPLGRGKPVLDLLESIEQALGALIGFAMRLAPIAVAALMFQTCGRLGGDVFRALAAYIFVLLAALVVHQFVVIAAIVRTLGGMKPSAFFRGARIPILTAFSTASSSASLPTALYAAEHELGVPHEIAGFVVPLGSAMNKHGTAIFIVIAAVFLAQVFHVELRASQYVTLLVLAVVSAIAAGGIPFGGIPLLALVLSTLTIPAEGLALILGVDQLMGMARTVLNVTDDLAAAVVVARAESGIEATA